MGDICRFHVNLPRVYFWFTPPQTNGWIPKNDAIVERRCNSRTIIFGIYARFRWCKGSQFIVFDQKNACWYVDSFWFTLGFAVLVIFYGSYISKSPFFIGIWENMFGTFSKQLKQIQGQHFTPPNWYILVWIFSRNKFCVDAVWALDYHILTTYLWKQKNRPFYKEVLRLEYIILVAVGVDRWPIWTMFGGVFKEETVVQTDQTSLLSSSWVVF